MLRDLTFLSLQLCNVFFTRQLQRRLDASTATKGIIVNCFNPGLIVGTGLFRDQNKVFTKVRAYAIGSAWSLVEAIYLLIQLILGF